MVTRPSFTTTLACSGDTNGSSGNSTTPFERPTCAPLLPTRTFCPRAGPAITLSADLGRVGRGGAAGDALRGPDDVQEVALGADDSEVAEEKRRHGRADSR